MKLLIMLMLCVVAFSSLVTTSCPDNLSGCLVLHKRWVEDRSDLSRSNHLNNNEFDFDAYNEAKKRVPTLPTVSSLDMVLRLYEDGGIYYCRNCLFMFLFIYIFEQAITTLALKH